MLADIVVDANVFLHADDERQACCIHSRGLIRRLKLCATTICVDEGFDLREAKNRSQIGSEYLRHLRFGTAGYAIVDYLAKLGRIKVLPRGVPQQVRKTVRRHVGHGTDRVYVQVAYNSQDRILASHDFTDISQAARATLLAALRITVIDAEEAVKNL